jgi:hypothetical protein
MDTPSRHDLVLWKQVLRIMPDQDLGPSLDRKGSIVLELGLLGDYLEMLMLALEPSYWEIGDVDDGIISMNSFYTAENSFFTAEANIFTSEKLDIYGPQRMMV